MKAASMTFRTPSAAWILLSILTVHVQPSEANVPAAYFACEGAENGDHCQLPGPRYGNCVLDTFCEDPPETEVNECLLCVDGCWGLEAEQACIMRDGRDGVCEAQPECTTDPEK